MMADTNRPAASIGISDTDTDTKPTTPALPKTATVNLTAPDGSLIYIVAERKGDAAKTYVITTGADRKSARGMTEHHASFEAAKAHIEKLARSAEKLGAKRKVTRRGFVAKPDAFASLAAIIKAKK
jgi:hypothetical protein